MSWRWEVVERDGLKDTVERLDEWLSPHHPDADAIRSRHKTDRGDYLSFERARLGWAIFIGRKP